MGTVYRKTAHYPLPGGAERFEKAGQTLARWRSKGKTVTAAVTVAADGTPTGRRRF